MFDDPTSATPPADEINAVKRDFMLQYILNSRLSGRSTDIDSIGEREKLVRAAGDLYDRTIEACMPAKGRTSGR